MTDHARFTYEIRHSDFGNWHLYCDGLMIGGWATSARAFEELSAFAFRMALGCGAAETWTAETSEGS